MKFLIVGRSGAGKDTLARELAKDGLVQVISYATRPKRFPDEQTHIFVSDEEAELLTDRVAETKIGSYVYFATREQVEHSDVYVIDPKGVKELVTNMPETAFAILYIDADRNERKQHAIERGSDRAAEEAIFEARSQAEDKQFTEFENWLNNGDCMGENVRLVVRITNTYDADALESMRQTVLKLRREHQNIMHIINVLVNHGVLELADANKDLVKVYYREPCEEKAVTKDVLASVLMVDVEGLGCMAQEYFRIVNL